MYCSTTIRSSTTAGAAAERFKHDLVAVDKCRVKTEPLTQLD